MSAQYMTGTVTGLKIYDQKSAEQIISEYFIWHPKL